jgi:hypothetical protein
MSCTYAKGDDFAIVLHLLSFFESERAVVAARFAALFETFQAQRGGDQFPGFWIPIKIFACAHGLLVKLMALTLVFNSGKLWHISVRYYIGRHGDHCLANDGPLGGRWELTHESRIYLLGPAIERIRKLFPLGFAQVELLFRKKAVKQSFTDSSLIHVLADEYELLLSISKKGMPEGLDFLFCGFVIGPLLFI